VEQFAGTGGISGAVLSNANKTLTIPLASIAGPKIIINGALANDTLTANLANSLGKIVDFNGGGQTSLPGDKLITVGGTFALATLNHTNSNDGSVVLDGNTINYTGLEPVDVTGSTITSLVINLPDTDDATDDVTEFSISGSNLIVDSVNGEHEDDTIALAGITSITINGRQGDDVITLLASMSGFAGAITIDGGLQPDDININAALSLGANILLVTGETIDLGANITSTAPQTYNGAVALASILGAAGGGSATARSTSVLPR
jgi:hypothetical protein